jgi:hypothetical protein
MVVSRRNKEEIMNAKPTLMLFGAVALSALAAVLASSAQARITEGNGTQPPSNTVVNQKQAPQVTSVVDAAMTSSPVVEPRLARQRSGTFFVDPGFYAAMTSPTVVGQRLDRHGSRSLSIDAEICANLDPAIRLAIQQCVSHPVPLAAKQIQTGTARLNP